VAVTAQGQDCTEFEKHLLSIDSTYYPGHVIDHVDSTVNANRAFVDYSIKYLLVKPSDQCYISNRNLLRRLKTVTCDSTTVTISDTLNNGSAFKLVLTTGAFEPSKHLVIMNADSTTIKKIDGQYPYGGEYGNPSIEIKNLRIEVNGSDLEIPREAFANFFSPNMCESYRIHRPIEVYESLSGNYFYLYLSGGNAAGTYFAKLVFDSDQYLTRIISDYYPLSIHSSFRDSFIGF
jgi:hypothetical protein